VNHKLYEQSITLVKNANNLIPFRVLDTTTFASVSIGLPANNTFQQTLGNYAAFQHYNVTGKDTSAAVYDKLTNKLSNFKVVVVSLHKMNSTASSRLESVCRRVHLLNGCVLKPM
jgi:hypothetical protein